MTRTCPSVAAGWRADSPNRPVSDATNAEGPRANCSSASSDHERFCYAGRVHDAASCHSAGPMAVVLQRGGSLEVALVQRPDHAQEPQKAWGSASSKSAGEFLFSLDDCCIAVKIRHTVLASCQDNPPSRQSIHTLDQGTWRAPGLAPYRAIEYTVARTILATSARWFRFTVSAVSVVL